MNRRGDLVTVPNLAHQKPKGDAQDRQVHVNETELREIRLASVALLNLSTALRISRFTCLTSEYRRKEQSRGRLFHSGAN